MEDVYSIISLFLKFKDMPILSRKYLSSHIQKKIYKLNIIPLLVDIQWHAPFVCTKYCVCNFASKDDRIKYYYRNNKT